MVDIHDIHTKILLWFLAPPVTAGMMMLIISFIDRRDKSRGR